MRKVYFHSKFVLIFVLTQTTIRLSFCERRVSQEEWHRYRFGGLALPSDPSQWAMGVPNAYQNVEAQVVNAPNPQVETNIQTVEVGKDKLVLVNDEGSIKMVKASQLPTVTKQASEPVTTQTPNNVIQMPLEQYFESQQQNNNPNKNQIEIISQNYGSGNRGPGLPMAFATGSKTGERPNFVYQNENPCKVGSDNPPIYIPASPGVVDSANTRSTGDNRKMVRIIIEMPESMTRNIDEASRYAATQVKRLRIKEVTDPDLTLGSKARRKVRKNVVIKKVVQMEEDKGDEDMHSEEEEEDVDEDMMDVASNHNHNQEQKNLIIAKNPEKNEQNGQKQYILIRRSGGRGRRPQTNLKAIDKYKKVIKVYEN